MFISFSFSFSMDFSQFNWVAILLATMGSFVVGSLWYSPLLFGKPWMKIMGFDNKNMQKMNMTPGQSMVIWFVFHLVSVYCMSLILSFLPVSTISQLLVTVFIVWLAFELIAFLNPILWENKPWKLFFINGSGSLVSLFVAAAILTQMA